jgi:alanyl-tRNA synthetase/misacylated tRNA(Ala) deacylase
MPSSAHVSEDGIELDRTVFYPLGGGQAGDSGTLVMADGTRWRVLDARKSRREGATPDDTVHLLEPASGWQRQLAPGTPLRAEIDWERRYRHMRFHTATHLLCAVVRRWSTGAASPAITPGSTSR